MIKVKKLIVGRMGVNCYLLWDSLINETIIIDPGDDAEHIIQTLQSNELIAVAIIATHGHFDHLLAALELKLSLKTPLYMNKEDEFLLKRMRGTTKHYLQYDPGPPPGIDFYIKNNSILTIGGLSIKTIHTPGHTPGSIALYHVDSGFVFTGDLMFLEGSGRADFSYSDKTKLARSITKIKKLGRVEIYPGHGDTFTLRKKMNPQEKLLKEQSF